MPELTLRFEGREYAIDGQRTLIGRDSSCHIVLEDDSVSGFHAEILREDTGLQLVDLDSTNGSFVDFKRVRGRTELQPWQRLRFGDVECELVDLQSRRPTRESPALTDEAIKRTSTEDLCDAPAFLVLRSHGNHPSRIALGKRILVGRAPECDLCLADEMISGRHACLERRGDGFELVDLGSTNGTYVNEQRVERTRLLPGDRVRFDKIEYIFQSTDQAPEAPGSAPFEGERFEADAPLVQEDPTETTSAGVRFQSAEKRPVNPADRHNTLLAAAAVSADQDKSSQDSRNVRAASGSPGSAGLNPIDRAWQAVWRLNILRPSIRILRGLIILATVASAIFVLLEVVVPGWSRSPALGVGLFVGLGIMLWLIYALAMIVPDLIHLVMRIEQSCGLGPDHGLGSRYPALRGWVAWLRLISLAWLGVIGANLVFMPLAGMVSGSAAINVQDDSHRAWLVGLGIAAAWVTGGYLLWQRVSHGGWGRVGMLPVLWLAVGSAAVLMWYEGLFHLVLPLISTAWLMAGMHALVSLVRSPLTIDLAKAWQWFAVVFLLALIVVLGGDVLWHLARFPFVALQLLGDEAAIGSLFEGARELGAGAGVVLLVLVIILRALMTWLGSDFLRSLTRGADGLVLRLGHSGGGGIHARFVTQCVRLFTLVVLGALAVLILQAPVTHSQLWYFDFTPQYQWGLPVTLAGLTALTVYFLIIVWSWRDLLLVSYDLREAASQVATGRKPMDLTSLRVVYGLGMFLATIGGLVALLVAARFLLEAFERSSDEYLLMAFVVLVGSGLVILLVTLPLMILRNLLDIEARTRPENAAAVTVSATYPGLSTVAGIGKLMAVLAASLVAIPSIFFVFAAFMEGRGEWVLVTFIGLFVAFVLYWLFSLIPDSIRLLLTLERNLCTPRGPLQLALAGGGRAADAVERQSLQQQ